MNKIKILENGEIMNTSLNKIKKKIKQIHKKNKKIYSISEIDKELEQFTNALT